jgi:hypothetical protein
MKPSLEQPAVLYGATASVQSGVCQAGALLVLRSSGDSAVPH